MRRDYRSGRKARLKIPTSERTEGKFYDRFDQGVEREPYGKRPEEIADVLRYKAYSSLRRVVGGSVQSANREVTVAGKQIRI